MPYICQCGCDREIPPSYLHGRRYEPKYISGHNVKTSGFAAQMAQVKARRITEMPDLICQCGCGEIIPPKPSHRYRPPKYIQAHYLKIGGHSRITKLREAKARERLQPPDGWVPPSGICECGCNKPTKIASCSRPQFDEYCGYPMRVLHGHHGRFLKGGKNGSWKGGRVASKQGYILLCIPGYPGSDGRGYILEHRYVYETSRGVRLTKDIHVHHINGIRHDNRPENLVAMTRSEHKLAHQFASEAISLFLDPRLNEAACRFVAEHRRLPNVETLTQEVYGRVS